MWDIDSSVRVVKRAAAHGLKGVNFPAPQQGLPTFEDSYWDPLFAACQGVGLPLVLHAGGGRRIAPVETYVGPAHYAILVHEIPFAGGRAMWHLIFSGVFDRFPGLNLVLTEVPGSWYVTALHEMDAVYDERVHAGPTLRRFLKRRRSEYVRSNLSAA